MAKKSQDTPKEEKFGDDFFGGGICPEIWRPVSKVVVLRIVWYGHKVRQTDWKEIINRPTHTESLLMKELVL